MLRIKTIKTDDFKPTENRKYYTRDGSNKLFARVGTGTDEADRPLELALDNDLRAKKGKDRKLYTDGTSRYEKYKVVPKYRSDCLHTTEETLYRAGGAGRENDKLKPTGDYSLEKTSGEKFGYTDQSNRKIAKKVRKAESQATNEAAAPDRGEGFAIVRMKQERGESFQYHAAPVIAQDGPDRITNEIFGSPDGKGMSEHNMPTEIRTYRVGDPNSSYHGTWKDSFGEAPVTVVLRTNPKIGSGDLLSDATPTMKKQRVE